jgi:hypothetical protein
MILGYVGIAVWVLGGIGMAIARIFIGQRYGVDLDGQMGGHMQSFDGGIMGGRGGFDADDQGGMMGNGWQMPNGIEPEAPVQTN